MKYFKHNIFLYANKAKGKLVNAEKKNEALAKKENGKYQINFGKKIF